MNSKSARARFLSLVSLERGALLWLPSLLVGLCLVLFAVRQAPGGASFFTRTTGMRLVVGPAVAAPEARARGGEFVTALCRGLSRHRDLSVVSPEIVGRRLEDGHLALPRDPRGWIRATRAFNGRFYIVGELQAGPGGELQGRVEAWEVAEERPVFALAGRGAGAEALGMALADSLCAALFRPEAILKGSLP